MSGFCSRHQPPIHDPDCPMCSMGYGASGENVMVITDRDRITELEAAIAKVTKERDALNDHLNSANAECRSYVTYYAEAKVELDALKAEVEREKKQIELEIKVRDVWIDKADTLRTRCQELEATLQSYRDTRAVSVGDGGAK
jgi:predicted  nucleic acid-binding Zn-ribbon protein